MRGLAILTAALFLAGGAQAEEAMSTAGAAGAAPPTDTARQIEDWIANSPAAREQEEGVLTGLVDPRDRKIHGEVGMAIGTGGYRSAYITSVMPVGENGTLALSLGQTKNSYGYGYDRFGRPWGGPMDYGVIR